jgi:hypothetical protein
METNRLPTAECPDGISDSCPMISSFSFIDWKAELSLYGSVYELESSEHPWRVWKEKQGVHGRVAYIRD